MPTKARNALDESLYIKEPCLTPTLEHIYIYIYVYIYIQLKLTGHLLTVGRFIDVELMKEKSLNVNERGFAKSLARKDPGWTI